MRERQADTVAPSLVQIMFTTWPLAIPPTDLTRLAARRGAARQWSGPEPSPRTVTLSEQERLAMLDLLGELKDRASVGLLLDLTTRKRTWLQCRSGTRHSARWASLTTHRSPSTLLAAYPRQGPSLAIAGAGAALESRLVGARLPGRDRSGRASGRRGDARPARAVRDPSGARSRRDGPQALGRDPRSHARGEARGGPAAQQRPAGRPLAIPRGAASSSATAAPPAIDFRARERRSVPT